MTFSYYYSDPDGNHVELQCDVFGDWTKSKEWMRLALQFKEDPLGKFVDPERVAADRARASASRRSMRRRWRAVRAGDGAGRPAGDS